MLLVLPSVFDLATQNEGIRLRSHEVERSELQQVNTAASVAKMA